MQGFDIRILLGFNRLGKQIDKQLGAERRKPRCTIIKNYESKIMIYKYG